MIYQGKYPILYPAPTYSNYNIIKFYVSCVPILVLECNFGLKDFHVINFAARN